MPPRPFSLSRSCRLWLFFPAALLVLFLFYHLRLTVFSCDAANRLDMAGSVVAGFADRVWLRVWLPFLQAHIYFLHLLKAPLFVYVLVPFVYTLVSLFFLSKLSLAAIPSEREAVGVAVLASFSLLFGAFRRIFFQLYQEPLVLPLLAAGLYLYFFVPRLKRWAWAVLAVGMLTRESFWVYYGVFGFLAVFDYKKISWKSLSLYLILGLIPIGWIFYTDQPFYLTLADATLSFSLPVLWGRVSYWIQLAYGRALLLPIILLAIVCAMIFFNAGSGSEGRSAPWRKYCIFSLLALLGIYGYAVLFDLNGARALFSLWMHFLFGCILAYGECCFLKNRLALVSKILILAALLLTIDPDLVRGAVEGRYTRSFLEIFHVVKAKDNYQQQIASAIRAYERKYRRSGPLKVGFVGLKKLDEYLPYYVAPFLYEERFVLKKDDKVDGLDLLIAPLNFSHPVYERYQILVIKANPPVPSRQILFRKPETSTAA